MAWLPPIGKPQLNHTPEDHADFRRGEVGSAAADSVAALAFGEVSPKADTPKPKNDAANEEGRMSSLIAHNTFYVAVNAATGA